MPRYLSTPLYGGALTVDLPEKFADVRCATCPLLPKLNGVARILQGTVS